MARKRRGRRTTAKRIYEQFKAGKLSATEAKQKLYQLLQKAKNKRQKRRIVAYIANISRLAK